MVGEEITQLLANQPIKLTPETDFFNTIPKAETILSFIESFSKSLEKNKLLALYGDWGSGKTSLIKYLQEKLDCPKFRTIYFETWKYEKDDNLALSLINAIVEKVDKRHTKEIKDLIKISTSLLKNFAKSISFQIPGISFDSNNLISGIEEDLNRQQEFLSFHTKIEEFKKSFLAIEQKLLKGKKERIIIFIDDLDRCEPENILNLLTALKHFFSNGKKTIFFCGIDKDAVTKAVKHKYKDVVKSEEYLEKIFDISFNMPKKFDILKILKYYFKDKYYGTDFYKLLNDFFTFIDFTTPRHIKKVLNKYLIVKYIKSKKLTNYELIPEIVSDHPFNIILVLYFIILFEFYKEIFYELQSTDFRKSVFFEKYYEFRKNIKKPASSVSPSRLKNEAVAEFDKHFGTKDITISEFFDDNSKYHLTQFANIFLPLPRREIDFDQNGNLYIPQFEKSGDNLQTSFCYFYMDNHTKFMSEDKNYYKIYDLFRMAKIIL
jgi:energy-coupling factor transporter ATP-binding protein EcfA2